MVLLKKLIIYAVCAYLLVFTVFTLNKRNPQFVEDHLRAQMVTLNNLRPKTFDYLSQISQGKEKVYPGRLKPYAEYFKRITEYLPSNAAGWGLLGFTLYYSGNEEEAMEAYRQAIILQPDFFWFAHNLGIIYFNHGQYEEAASLFQGALKLTPQVTLQYIISSPTVYGPILSAQGTEIAHQLKLGYINSILYLKECFRRLGEEQMAEQVEHFYQVQAEKGIKEVSSKDLNYNLKIY